MYKVLIFLFVIILGSCKSSQKQQSKTDNNSQAFENFDWLLGDWERTNEKENRKTFETWLKKDSLQYVGFGITLEQNDTIWQEYIVLERRENEWFFKVSGVGDKKATEFVLTEIAPHMFTSVNEQNEFPKQIKYSRNKEKLNAVISGGNVEIPFEFERCK